MIGKDDISVLRSQLNNELGDKIAELVKSYCDSHDIPLQYVDAHIHVCLSVDALKDHPPLCAYYDGGAVFALWPSGRVQRFPSIAKAMTLMDNQYQIHLVSHPDEAMRLVVMRGDEYIEKLGATSEELCSSAALWQYLHDIAEERNPWQNVKHDNGDSARLTRRTTSAGYNVRHSACKTFANGKQPKQAKVLAAAFLDFEDNAVVTDEDINKLLQIKAAQGVLKTKQDVSRIFAYYRKALLDGGALQLRN